MHNIHSLIGAGNGRVGIHNTKLHFITNSRERKESMLDDSCLIVKFCAVLPEENIKYKYRNKVCQTGYSPSSGH